MGFQGKGVMQLHQQATVKKQNAAAIIWLILLFYLTTATVKG